MATQNSLQTLRLKHPVFRYRSFAFQVANQKLHANFDFLLEPNIHFAPSITIPLLGNEIPFAIDNFVFHLGLIEMLSYWKASCAPRIVVEAGNLSAEQLEWWRDLFLHGLGEFYFRNSIHFSSPDFFTIEAHSGRTFEPVPVSDLEGDLVLSGGGKDSAVTLELLKSGPAKKRRAFVLYSIDAAEMAARTSGYGEPITVQRVIDPSLLALNKAGYLNGHTPFSAYLAFLGTFVAALHGLRHVIAANEQSANEANTELHGMAINHQYSKSYRFEKLFRAYAASYVTSGVEYFSALRPLGDLTISALFAGLPSHFAGFRSCNVGQKTGSWCGKCAKCAFVYLTLLPFLPDGEAERIFGSNFLLHPEIIGHVRGLVNLEAVKPFECVGTVEESCAAFALCLEKIRASSKSVPAALLKIESELSHSQPVDAQKVIQGWSREHFLPPEYERLLRLAVEKLQ